MSSFLSSIADKAQSAINASPLAGHIPQSVSNAIASQGSNPPQQGGAHVQTTTPPPTGGGTGRHYAIENLQHSLRSLQVQYSNQVTEQVKQIQLMITAQKGVALDYESVCRDAKNASKEMYTWGQTEKADIKDVTDRLAWINFVHGSLSSTLSQSLEGARAPFKQLRDAETAIFPKRNLRKGVHMQIQSIKAESKSAAAERKVAELTAQLKKMEADDAQAEREIEILKRNAIREMEQKKWAALREYGEKLVLLSQASENLLSALPSIPPSMQMPYTGETKTASVRASLQRALDNYKTGHIQLATRDEDATDSDTRSFGETHADELSSMSASTASLVAHGEPAAPSGQAIAAVAAGTAGFAPGATSPPYGSAPVQPIDAAALNHSPAAIPDSASASATPATAGTSETHVPATDVLRVPSGPTVAETGMPVIGGTNGPASGTLAGGHVSGNAGFESAEEEKRRLEREERERILREGGSSVNAPPAATQLGRADTQSSSRTKDEEGGAPPAYEPY